jgi:hypothetical protein
MTRDSLGLLWQERFNRPVPVGVRKELLIRMLAYRIQELAFGGLSGQARRRLDQLISGTDARHQESGQAIKAQIGTQLIREWRGKTYTVVVQESGFQFDGCSYRSLSQIARHITGTQWSGPLFFGLKSQGPKKVSAHAE